MSSIKVGHRVTVKEGVSHRQDEGSIQDAQAAADKLCDVLTLAEIAEIAKKGQSRKHLAGRKGGVVQIRADGMVLVDDQYTNGQFADGKWTGAPVGKSNLREWFAESELEVG